MKVGRMKVGKSGNPAWYSGGTKRVNPQIQMLCRYGNLANLQLTARNMGWCFLGETRPVTPISLPLMVPKDTL